MIFFDPNLSGKITLPESKHLFSCRVKKGDIIKLSNLKGDLMEVEISLITKQNYQIEYKILSQKVLHKPADKIIFQAIPAKNYLEKMVEILPIAGVTRVYLFKSKHSGNQNFSLNRLNLILTRSCEQSENCFLPEIKLLKEGELHALLLQTRPVLLHQGIVNDNPKASTNAVLVGPEGGFSDLEISKFNTIGLSNFSLGTSVYPAWLAGFGYFSKFL